MAETYLFAPGRPSLQDGIDIDTLSSLTFFIDNGEYARAHELFTEDAVMDYSRLRYSGLRAGRRRRQPFGGHRRPPARVVQ